MRLTGNCAFRVLRDSDLEVEEEAEDLVREIRDRAEAPPPRQGGANEAVGRRARRSQAHHHGGTAVREAEVIEVRGLVGISAISELVNRRPPRSAVEALHPPRGPRRVQDHERRHVRRDPPQGTMLLHHPYETFDMVVRFLQQAARDPDVVAIKQTLYRTSRNSPIVDALCEAAEDGKSVTALVELKARFDEGPPTSASRAGWNGRGRHVIYGFIQYKTHAKISTVVRREGERLVTYTHYGTGNYHPITARIYTDLSFLHLRRGAGRDATKVFNYVGGYAEPQGLENLKDQPGHHEALPARHDRARGRGRAPRRSPRASGPR